MHIATSSQFLLAVNGQWGPFGNWSSCSRSCDGGTHTRQRQCNNPPPSNGGQDCVGIATHQDRCNTDACPGEKCINGLCKCIAIAS